MKNAKLSVEELALNLTKANIQKTRSSKKSINDYLVEILGDGKTSMTRIELTNAITLKRLEENEEVTEESFKDEEFLGRFAKMNKTVKNGLDTSISKGKSSSCFVSSRYKDEYELLEDDNKKYSLKSKN